MFDTIVAISTALSKSAINIIRISGDNSKEILSKIVSKYDPFSASPNTIKLAKIVDEQTQIDQVLISYFKAPHSFTGEDMFEINTHGGVFVTNKVLELLIKNGARLAERGEFSKRAYLNGKMDMSQAEAINDLINARSDTALKLSSLALNGKTKELITSLRSQIEKLILQITVNIDYPEYLDEVQVTTNMISDLALNMKNKLDFIIKRAESLRIYKEGIKTVIVGKPNVGKSSLLNTLLSQDKAIVSDIAGTTRDIVEGEIQLDQITLHLIDTAGIRESDDKIEKIGIDKSLSYLQEAELVLLLLDLSEDISEEDLKLIELTKDKPRIIIGNKLDIKSINISYDNYVELSTKTSEGVDKLKKLIEEMFIKEKIEDDLSCVISSSRHILLLKQAYEAISRAYDASLDGEYMDLIDIELNDAYNILGQITGSISDDELIDALFKNFCLGK